MNNSITTAVDIYPHEDTVYLFARYSTGIPNELNLVRALEYSLLQKALRIMQKSDEGTSLKIDDETYFAATHFIDVLEAADVAVPTVFAHGGDAVTFVWEGQFKKRFVTIGDPQVSLFEIPKGSEPAVENTQLFEDDKKNILVATLGGRTWSQQSTASLETSYSPYAQSTPALMNLESPWANFHLKISSGSSL